MKSSFVGMSGPQPGVDMTTDDFDCAPVVPTEILESPREIAIGRAQGTPGSEVSIPIVMRVAMTTSVMVSLLLSHRARCLFGDLTVPRLGG